MARDCHACYRALVEKLANGERDRLGTGIAFAQAELQPAKKCLDAGDVEGFCHEIGLLFTRLSRQDMAGTSECLEILKHHHEPVAA